MKRERETFSAREETYVNEVGRRRMNGNDENGKWS